MQSLEERISKIEAVQFFQLAMIGAAARVCAEHPKFAAYARENLQRNHAILVGESVDEVKVAAFEELMHEILGGT